MNDKIAERLLKMNKNELTEVFVEIFLMGSTPELDRIQKIIRAIKNSHKTFINKPKEERIKLLGDMMVNAVIESKKSISF